MTQTIGTKIPSTSPDATTNIGKQLNVEGAEFDDAAGAIAIKEGVVVIGGSGVTALTLAAPVSGAQPAGDDGKTLRLVAQTTHAHTVTTPSNKISPSHSVITFAAALDLCDLVAYGGLWLPVYTTPTNVVISCGKMLEEGIYSLLAESGPVQELLGTDRVDGTTGIFPGLIKEGSDLPALVYLQIHGEEMQTLDGRGELRSARVQLSAYGSMYADAKHTAKAVKDTLIGYHGQLNDGTEVDSISLLSEIDSFVKSPLPSQETGGRSLYHTAVDVEIWYRE